MNVTTKSAALKAAEARQEPRQHALNNKPRQKKNYVYVVEENELLGSKVVVREKGWNVWDRATDEQPQTTPAPSSSSSSSPDLNQWCSYHKSKAHDTRDCKHLVDALFTSYEKGTSNVELPKPRPNNAKNWSKNKEKKAQKPQDKASARPKHAEDDKPNEQDEDEACANT